MGKAILIVLIAGFLQVSLAGNSPVRILPVGDSITHGYWSGITTDYNSYRRELKNLLDSNGHSVDFVGSLADGNFPDNQHDGHDGWFADHDTKTNRILDHVAGWMTATAADIVLLHIGTNDIHGDNANATEVSDILDEIFGTNSKATVVLALIINARIDYDKRDETSTYNSNMNTMAQGRIAAGDDIIVVDMENGAGLDYANPSDDMGDTRHPSQLGYDKMATNWYPVVVQAIARQRPPLRIGSVAVSESMILLGIDNLATGKQTVIEQTGSLSTLAWTNAATFIPSTTHTNWMLPVGPTNTFYRIVIP